MANRVFEDRLGLWIVNPANFPARAAGIRALGVKDVFLPRSAQPSDFAAVRAALLYARLWAAVDGLSAADYANRTLLDIQRLRPGAVELNIELNSDPPLAAYIREVITLIRSKRRFLRLRINIAPFKAVFLPADLLTSDPNLYACEQTYAGGMRRFSEADCYDDLLSWDVPPEKATLCYGAAQPNSTTGPSRVVALPDLSRRNQGVIFQDDLCAEVGLL